MKSEDSFLNRMVVLITLITGLLNLAGVLTSFYLSKQNQALVFLGVVYIVITFTLSYITVSKKKSRGKQQEYNFPLVIRVPAIILTSVFTLVLAYLIFRAVFPVSPAREGTPIITSPSTTAGNSTQVSNNQTTFFSKEKLIVKPCYYGKTDSDKNAIWEVLKTGDGGTAYIEMLLLTSVPVIIDSIDFLVDDAKLPDAIDQYDFYEDPFCVPPGGGPLEELNFKLLSIDLSPDIYTLRTEDSDKSVILPYQLDKNEALKIYLPFVSAESGIYSIHLRASIAFYDGKNSNIESGQFLYHALVLTNEELENLQINKL